MVSMNRLTTEKRAQVIAALVEGNSIRSTCRMTGVAKGTVTKLLVDMGTACSIYMDEVFRDLPCQRMQCDEIWAFCGMKQRNVPLTREMEEGLGDVWTWIAIDPDTKLVPTYRVGGHELNDAKDFMLDLAKRLRHRIQLTTDAYRAYPQAVREAFHGEIDYAVLQKLYGEDHSLGAGRRYSPAKCIGIARRVRTGDPDPAHMSTSGVERQNLTMRMMLRRYTRLTNGFSKKIANLTAAVSIHFAFYNLCRVHTSLKGQTPAMAAGVSDHVWTLPELIGLLESAERVPVKRGPYKKRRTADSN
jgi:IS1 family transposase